MTRRRLPRRRVLSHAERRVVERPDARYRFAVDVLSCGHEIYSSLDPTVKARGCQPCADGGSAGFHPKELRS